ncbi:MAG TPA: nuclear transport factor 2 family protein [Edaphocola sp.]|nr:nuclear transport factor 2 family protein [Edaphocola sp.]
MKKVLILLVLQILCVSLWAQKRSTEAVNKVMDDWHKAAATANFDGYFNAMTTDAVFMGTDATERWDKVSFMTFAKPYFDRKKAWNFTALERHISFSKNGKTAWIDELLDTQMKICRGSGVLEYKNGKWQIAQYVLSMTIPNNLVDQVVPLKTKEEDAIIRKFRESQN